MTPPTQSFVVGLVVAWFLSVVLAVGSRPVPFRTRKLSPPAPMVLHSGGCGRVGRRRHKSLLLCVWGVVAYLLVVVGVGDRAPFFFTPMGKQDSTGGWSGRQRKVYLPESRALNGKATCVDGQKRVLLPDCPVGSFRCLL